MQYKLAISAGFLIAAQVAVLGWNAALPGAVQASCAAPTAKVIWSYPAAGQVDVPLDSDLLMVTEGIWGEVQVTLEGELLTAGSEFGGHFDLRALEPNTTYTVAITSNDDASPAVDLHWTFTTGDAALDEDVPLAMTVQEATSEAYAFDDEVPCSPALLANTCFDTGTPSLQTFETDVEATLWVIERVVPNAPGGTYWLYPGECGQPRMLDYLQIATSNQYRVHAILRDGSIVSSEAAPLPFSASTEDDEPAASGPGGASMGEGDDAGAAASSCAVSAVGRGRESIALPLLAAVAFLSTRRRFAAKRC